MHYLAPGCRFDFSGTDVTVAAGAKLIATTPGEVTVIQARSMTVRGSISVIAGFLLLQGGDVAMAGSGTLRARRASAPGYSGSEISIVASRVDLSGRLVSARGDVAGIQIEAAGIAVNSRILAQACTDTARVLMFSFGGPSIVGTILGTVT